MVSFNSKLWLLGGWNPKEFTPNGITNEIWSSPDGYAWNFEGNAPWSARHLHGRVVFHNKIWVISGDNNDGQYKGDVWNSADGNNWVKVLDNAPWSNRVSPYVVVFNDKIWLMGGQQIQPQGDTVYNDIWNTDDGVVWQKVVEHAPWTPRAMVHGAAILNNKIWIYGGGDYNKPEKFYNDIWSSSDGITWNSIQSSPPWQPRVFINIASFDNKLWVLDGSADSGDRNDVWCSSDGTTWSELTGTPWPARHAASVAVFDSSLWVVAGRLKNDVWRLKSNTLVITAPNGGTLMADSIVNVSWKSTLNTTVSLEYRLNNEPTWLPLASNIPASQGEYLWNTSLLPLDIVKLRIKSDLDPSVCDIVTFDFKKVNLSQGVSAFYPLNSNVLDASVNHYNGSEQNTLAATDRFGNPSGAIAFNGTTSFVSLPAQNYTPFTGDFTISFWEKSNSSNVCAPLSIGAIPQNFDVYFNSSGIGLWPFWNGSGANGMRIFEAGQYTKDAWVHIAITRKEDRILLFIDGDYVFQTVYSGPIAKSDNIILGYSSSISQRWNGTLDELRIYQRSLNDQEISLLANYSNHSPQIVSVPMTEAIEDSLFTYAVCALDQDSALIGDRRYYRLLENPNWLEIDSLSGTITGIPRITDLNDAAVKIEVTDDAGAVALQDFTIHVQHKNHAPLITPSATLTSAEDMLFTFAVHATDADTLVGDLLRYRLSSAPIWMQIDPENGRVTGIPRGVNVGDTTFIVEVLDAQGVAATQEFSLKVIHTNHPPHIITSALKAIQEDSLYYYGFKAIDSDSALFGDRVHYRFLQKPAWLEIDSLTGVVTGIPRINNLRDTIVTIEAYDNMDGATTQQFYVNIRHTNHVPSIISSGVLIAREDSAFVYKVIVADVDTLVGDVFRYHLSEQPVWMYIDSLDGSVSGTPYGSDVGASTFKVVVDDSHGGIDSKTFNIQVVHTNHPPIVTVMPAVTAIEDSLYHSIVYASDKDSSLFQDRVRYVFLLKPAWLAIDSVTGAISGTPHIAELKDSSVTLQAYDTHGAVDSLHFYIHIQHTNHQPSIFGSGLLTAKEDSLFAFAVSAADIDTLVGDILHFRLIAKPAWLQIDSLRGVVSGTPDGTHVGDTTFTVLANDGHGGTASRSFALKILHMNHAPVIRSNPAALAIEDASYLSNVWAADQDSLLFGDRVRYRFITRPAWLAIDSVTGIISGTPNITHLADTSAAVQAYDNAGGADTLRFSIPIRHVNHPPQLAGIALQVADEDARFSFRAVGSDIDTLAGDLLRYRMSPVISWLRIDTISGSVSGIPGEFNVGDTTTTLIVTDKAGVSASTPLAIRVRHVNHDPVFNTNDLPNAVEDTLYIVKIDAEDRDSLLFGDRLTYSLKGPVWLSIDPLTGLISGTPIGINARDTVVGVGVSDGNGGAIYQTMTLHVKHVNHTPVILSQPLIAAREDSTYRYKVITADQDSVLGDKVRVLSTIIPSWMKFDSSKAEYVGIPGPSQVGDTTISFSVIDGSGAQTVQKFVISVSHTNHAPQIITQSVPDAIEDSSYASSISAIDSDGTAFGDKLVYRVSGNSWLTIDSVSGALKGKPGLLNVQKNGFTITVLDGQGGVTTQAYTLTVRHTNHPPVFTSIPDTLVFEDSLYAYHPVAIDMDTKLFNDVVTDTLISAPAFLSASGVLGAISGIPRNDYFNWNRANIRLGVSGAYADTIVTIRARDDKGASALQRFALRVVHRNHSPVILSMPDTAAVEDAAYLYKISVSDIDKNAFNDSTIFTFISKPAWLSYNAVDSSITGVASGVNVRDSIVVFEISDGNGGRARQSFNLHVTPVNHPPVISSIPRPAAFEDSLYVYMIQTQDPDRQFKRDSVTLRLVSGPSWLSLNRETMTLSGKPEWMDIGDSLVTIEAKDLAGGTAYQNWRLAVNGVRYVPLPQGLLFPKRSDTVTVQAVSSEIKFGWKSAKDRNLHDTLFYRVHCWKDHVDTLTSWMRDTTWTLNWTRTASTIHDFNWTVFVTDKYYTVQAKDTFTVIIKGLTTGVREWDSSIPADYIVYQNYPNPFNPSTTIRFGLPERSKVSVDIYNTLGQLVESVYHDMVLDPRYYEVVWNANGRANGMYLAVMHAESFSQPHRNFRSVKKLLLIK